MKKILKEVSEALNALCAKLPKPDGFAYPNYYAKNELEAAAVALAKLDALIAQEKAEPQYLSIERVEGFPEKLEQGPQPLLYSDGINGCMVRRDDVWLALTSQLAMPHSAPSTSPPLTVKQRVDIADACEEMDFDDDYLGIVSKVIDLTEAAHKIGA